VLAALTSRVPTSTPPALIAIENHDHFHAPALHLLARGERAAQIGKVEGLVFVANPMAIG